MMALDPALLGLSFVAGSAAFLNPCGFAMLPTYIAYYLGSRSHYRGSRWYHGAVGGVIIGTLTTLGFMLVFGLIGLIFSLIGVALAHYIPWIAFTAGIILFTVGAGLAAGKTIRIPLPPIPAPRLYGNPGLTPFFIFGVGYAIASLSCTIPIFLLVVFQALSAGSLLGGSTVFMAYALGMGVMMLILSVAVGVSRQALVSRFRSSTRYFHRVAGAVMMASALYIVYFQIYLGGAI